MDWTNIYEFAAALKESRKAVRMRRAFDLASQGDDLSIRLSGVTGRYSPVRQHPLLMALQLGQAGATEALVTSPEDEQWLQDASEVAALFSTAIEFLRSRIPGYPSLRVPHLRAGSPHVFSDPFFVSGFPWEAGMRRMGLQLQSAPEFAEALESDRPLADLLQAAVADLEASAIWVRFADARRALQAADWTRLSEIGHEFAERTRPEATAAATGGFLLANIQYRIAVIADLVDISEGRVHDYLVAFEELNELLSMAASLVETVVVSAGLASFVPKQMAVGEGDDLRPVHLVAQGDDPMLHAGAILYVNGPTSALSGFVYSQAVSHDWKRLQDNPVATLTATGFFSAA